jgi:fibronectin type 3 domain-containing protein
MQVFQKEAKVIASISRGELLREIASGHLVYRDRDAAGSAPAPAPGARGPRFLYGIQVVDERGQRSPLSTLLEISLVPPPRPPTALAAAIAEGEVRLSWESGESGKSGELYNVYRRTAAQEELPLQLNPAPLSDRTFVDTTFRYGESYRYSVRALPAPPPPLHESAPSEEVEVRPLDVYAPKAPTGLAAAVEGQAVKLYWFPNSEADLRGYRIFRREARTEFQQLAEVDAAETSYADASAAHGVRYYYAVTAVDGATPPNESARSEEVSEAVPADAAP